MRSHESDAAEASSETLNKWSEILESTFGIRRLRTRYPTRRMENVIEQIKYKFNKVKNGSITSNPRHSDIEDAYIAGYRS